MAAARGLSMAGRQRPCGPRREHRRPYKDSPVDRLLQVKLTPPRSSHRRISRPRLTTLLDGTLEARLLLLSAPPGFGKTTALVDWLAASGVKHAWLSLDEADNDPVRFLRYLWAAVTSIAADGPRSLTGAAPSAEVPAVIAEVATILAETPEPSLLVLDDYHVIEAGEVQRAVAILLDLVPPQAHLVIATRVDPALPLARLRARAELLEVRADALRFTSEEARSFFAERMGLALSDSEIETLVARTEGWPAVLQLAGLSLTGRTDVPGYVREFAATHRFVLDFITEEVLGRLDRDQREFLLRTSVLDRLTGPVCDALTDRTDGQAMLERLERANLLLVPLDDERRWYRYHRLFADLLRARLGVEHPTERDGLHLRAADWYEREGMIGDAIGHALRSGDRRRARDLIAKASPDLIHHAEFATLRGWLDTLPAEVVRSDLLLSTFYAYALVLAGQREGVSSRLADAEAALPEAAAAGHPSAATVPIHIFMIRSIVARLEHDVAGAVANAEQAVALVPAGLPSDREALVLGDALAILGHALLDAGELDRAIDAYREARPLLRRAGNRLGEADITRNLARLEVRRGCFRAALEACDEALADAVGGSRFDLPALAPVHLARAEVLERMSEAGVAEAAEHALHLARRSGDVVTIGEARTLLERVTARHTRRSGQAQLVEPLTERELEVLRLVAAGRSNRQIAGELFLALGTVKSHVHSISGKLGAANRVEAIVTARELNLLT
jgi:LuxR family transcriptional regulator, maltose regulon positive regulatory protein